MRGYIPHATHHSHNRYVANIHNTPATTRWIMRSTYQNTRSYSCRISLTSPSDMLMCVSCCDDVMMLMSDDTSSWVICTIGIVRPAPNTQHGYVMSIGIRMITTRILHADAIVVHVHPQLPHGMCLTRCPIRLSIHIIIHAIQIPARGDDECDASVCDTCGDRMFEITVDVIEIYEQHDSRQTHDICNIKTRHATSACQGRELNHAQRGMLYTCAASTHSRSIRSCLPLDAPVPTHAM